LSGWNFDQGNGKTTFTKFTPGGLTKIRIIDEEPIVRWGHYLPQYKRTINCPGQGCPICEIRKQQKANKQPYTYGVARRFAINVINRDTNKVEIVEQGIIYFNDLKDILSDLKSKNKSFIDVDLKVRRRGTGKDDTSYRIDIDSESPLSDTDIKMIDEKTILATYFKPHTIEQILRIVQGESWDDVMKRNEEYTEEKFELQIS